VSGVVRRRGVEGSAADPGGRERASGPIPRAATPGSPPPAVRLRAATPADRQRTWAWRNDPDTRAASLDSEAIPWETHVRWFADALARGDRKLFVVEAGGEAAGTVRLDISGADGTISIHLAREWRGRGLGTRALRALAGLAFGDLGIARLLASVKPDNHASLAAFAKAGFTRVESGTVVVLERRRPA
jgi:RimJ/RimL family protein N-acetyltransferase